MEADFPEARPFWGSISGMYPSENHHLGMPKIIVCLPQDAPHPISLGSEFNPKSLPMLRYVRCFSGKEKLGVEPMNRFAEV
jgi:hypothetical protein